MVDVLLLAMVIASAVSLIVLSPREAQRDTLRTLREYDEVGAKCKMETEAK